MDSFIKGMDLSTLMEVEACGGKFHQGRQIHTLDTPQLELAE